MAGPGRWLALAALAVVVPFLGKPPVLDEESYLWLGGVLDPARPYDWTRAWPPYDADDGFVYAHPPGFLWWMWLARQLADAPALLRLVAGAPWIVLLALSVGALLRRTTAHPGLAAALWLASPVVVLGLQDTWMIDLPTTALFTATLAAYREGLARDARRVGGAADGGRAGEARPTGAPGPWFVLAGLALGLGAVVKYPVLVLVPVLAAHMARYGWRPAVFAVAAAVIAADEALLYASYGRVHLWEVWARRAEIASGPLDDRVLGVLARLPLVCLPLALLRADLASAAAGAALGAAALGWAQPRGMGMEALVGLGVAAALGGMAVARAARAVAASGTRRRHDDRGDPLLLGGAALAVIVGVAVGHNYASARYLWPAAAPLAALFTRSAEGVPGGKALTRATVALGAVLALGVAMADLRYARAGAEVARAAVAELTQEAPARRFAAEWALRGVLEKAGWTRYRPDEALPAGTLVLVADNASPGEVDLARLEPVDRVESRDSFPLRVNDLDAGASLYAETLGVLPLGWSKAPLEGATLFVVRGE